MQKMNFSLLKKIRESGMKQRDFARAVGDHETVVSRIVNGVWNADPMRKSLYSKVLKCKIEDIFSE